MTMQRQQAPSSTSNPEPMTDETQCMWKKVDEGIRVLNAYVTDCGHEFWLNDDTPTDNDMEFCCFCGRPLIEED